MGPLDCLVMLFETRPGHTYELELGLSRRAGRHAPFGDILLAAPGGLDHLIMSSRAAIDEPVAERCRRVIDDLRHLIRFQIPVASMSFDQAGLWFFIILFHGSPI